MMTKKQKIWMWIFIAMFAVPEILWSPVMNFYYQLSQTGGSGGTHPLRYNFLQYSDNLSYLKFVIFVQLLGLIGALIIALKNKNSKNKILRYLFILLLSLFVLIVGFVLYFALSFSINVM
jgi:hypothetical protein